MLIMNKSRILIATGLLCSLCVAAALAQAPSAATRAAPKKVSPYAAGGMPESARGYYTMTWGVDQLSVKLVESGQLVRFNYRVVDATKAQPLQDKASNPNLLDEEARAVLVVPTMEKVGPLRQSMAAENGKSYWMVFSNKGNFVHKGHRVSIVIGSFRVDGLIVQ